MSKKISLVRTTSALIVSSSANAEKWRGVRSVFGLVTEIASAPSKAPKKSDHFAPKEPVAVIEPKAEIRPEEAAEETASAPSDVVVEVTASAPSDAAELKAKYAKHKAARKAAKN